MIEGKVDDNLEARIELSLELLGGDVAVIDATIDTGYSGKLVLPRSLLEESGLPMLTLRRVMLADGTFDEWPRYDAVVLWHGVRTHVDILGSEGEILVGMELMKGSRLTIDIAEGGRVEIEPFE